MLRWDQIAKTGLAMQNPVGVMNGKTAPALLFVALLALLTTSCQRQDQFPSRPLQLVCPWAVGGGTDRCSRQIATLLELELGQPVNVVNATGGAGVTGHSRGARARPDGYTLVMMTVEINMLRHRGLTDLSYKDYEPLGLINRDAAALFVSKNGPWKDLEALTQAVKKEPGKLSGSGTAKGGIWHLALAGWLETVGLSTDAVNWIPSTGAAPSLQELAGGGIDMVCCSLPEAQSLLDAGEIRCVGVMADKRLKEYPDVPTFREKGIDWEMGGWRGLGLPLGVPRPIRDKIFTAVDKLVHSERFTQFMEQAGFDASWEAPEQFSKSLEENDVVLGDLLKEQFTGLKEEQYGPMFFPKLVGSLLAVVTVVVFAQSLHHHFRVKSAGVIEEEELVYKLQPRRLLELGYVILVVIGFILVVETVGFVIAAALFLLALLIATRTNWILSAVCVAVLIPLLYEIFARQFRVPLPVGLFGW